MFFKKNNIIGHIKGEPISTNVPTTEKFDCKAYKDAEKKKQKEQDLLRNELDRINNSKF